LIEKQNRASRLVGAVFFLIRRGSEVLPD